MNSLSVHNGIYVGDTVLDFFAICHRSTVNECGIYRLAEIPLRGAVLNTWGHVHAMFPFPYTPTVIVGNVWVFKSNHMTC